LSWLKKMFGRLNDDDNHSDEPSFQEERQVDKPIKTNDKNREIEARVSYHYPKGEFRFPVIPDKRDAAREERVSRSEQRRQRRSTSRDEEAPSDKKKEVQKEQPEPKKASKKDDAARRPFRPTEIPSPIYGFSRPVKKDPIQYELKSSEPRNWKNTDKLPIKERTIDSETAESFEGKSETGAPVSKSGGSHVKDTERVVHIETSFDKRTEEYKNEVSEIEQSSESETEPSILQFEDSSLQLHETEEMGDFGLSETPSTYDKSYQDVSTETSETEYQKQNQLPELDYDLDEPVQEPTAESPAGEPTGTNEIASPLEESGMGVNVEEPVLEEVPTAETEIESDEGFADPLSSLAEEPVEEETAEEGSTVKIQEPERYADSEAPVQESALESPETEIKNSEERENHLSEIEEPVQEQQTFVPNSESEEASSQEESTPAQGPASKRSHLPFNVLMLKQDKRMMDRKKRLAEMGHGRVQEIEESTQTEQAATAEGETAYEKETLAVQPQGLDEQLQVPADQEEVEGISTEEVSGKQTQYHGDEIKPSINEEESLKEEEPQQEQSAKRSHLPFNVLMLKQDKRKMNPHREPAPSTGDMPTDTAEENKEKDTSIKKYAELADQPVEEEGYAFPQLNFLAPPVMKESSDEWLETQKDLLNDTLANFNVRASVVNVTEGPAVTRFEVQPEPGVKVNKITNLADDIKLSLAARDIRIEAPIPGKHTIGIEVPNKQSRPVALSEIISSTPFQEGSSPLTAALGLDISGEPIVTDLNKMPHGLIAGATGSGKSVCINSILVSLLYKASPQDLKMLLIDPKMVELAPYNRMPHLVSPVITDVKAATAALKWAVEEMERRYELFAHTGVRDISRYNLKAERNGEKSQKLPYLVIVIDELADLMMMSPADVEEAICRIAQKARACGIHLIIATQRPSVDVITGLIKANVPTRIAFSVSSGVDSRTIIDSSGAEKLLGRGDMLFLENGSSKPVRLQGTFVSDDEIDEIVNHVREQGEPNYLFQQDELLKKAQVDEQEDELFLEACEFVVDQGGASTSLIQRHFRVGYNRAARLIDMMESHGIVSEAKGSKPRDVLISSRELEELQETSTII
jgi:DNA segregation ATPase FtsK/SpoIIIE, S-DNA-T family